MLFCLWGRPQMCLKYNIYICVKWIFHCVRCCLGLEHVQIQNPGSGLAAWEVLLHFRSPAEVPLGKTPECTSPEQVSNADTFPSEIAEACAVWVHNNERNPLALCGCTKQNSEFPLRGLMKSQVVVLNWWVTAHFGTLSEQVTDSRIK